MRAVPVLTKSSQLFIQRGEKSYVEVRANLFQTNERANTNSEGKYDKGREEEWILIKANLRPKRAGVCVVYLFIK